MWGKTHSIPLNSEESCAFPEPRFPDQCSGGQVLGQLVDVKTLCPPPPPSPLAPQWASAGPINPAPTISPPDPPPSLSPRARGSPPQILGHAVPHPKGLPAPGASTPSQEACEDREVRGRSRARWPGVAGGGSWGWWKVEEWPRRMFLMACGAWGRVAGDMGVERQRQKQR